MLNAQLAGKNYPGASYRVTAEAIHKYAAATNDASPAVTSGDPVAPPAFACVLGIDQLNRVMYDPDLNVDMSMLVHARQEHLLHRPVNAGDLIQVATVLEQVDLAETGHTFTVAMTLTNQAGEVAAEARSMMFIRRTGTVKAPPAPVESGKPLFEAHEEVAGDQAARYAEASGDHNPIHLDPAAAKSAGFPNVVLHGMCTMAFAAKALVTHLANGDPRRIRRIKVDFARPVLPGQTLITRGWSLTGEGESGLDAFGFETVNARGSAVLKGGRVDVVDLG